LKHIERTNRWEILSTERDEALGLIVRRPLGEGTGTVVVWQRLDRILGYKYPYGEMARKRLSQICREIEVHLGMVFHRFMMGEIKGKRIKLRLNGNEIKPWDPFCRNETKTRKLQPLSLRVEQEGGTSGSFRLEPYVLPHQDDFSSADAFRTASGPANWNQQQGFYVYRGGRMIQSGGWCGLRAPDEHMKLARIALSFSPKLDELFKINVAKMRVQLPSQSREETREALLPSTKAARAAYDRRPAGPRLQSLPSRTVSTSPGGSIGTSTSPTSDTTKPPATVMLTRKQWADRLLAKATKRERPVVEAVLNRL
jgi:hypothetical protein